MRPSDIPNELPPAGPEPIEPGRPRRNRLLMGCLVAAGIVVVLILVSIFSFVTWIRQPGPVLDPALLVDRDTVLYAEVHLRPGDEAVRDFMLKAVEQTRALVEQERQEAPEAFPWIFGGSREGPTAEDIEKNLPVVVIVTRQETGPGTVSRALMAVNVPRLGNRLRFVAWLMTLVMGWADEGGTVLEHRDEKIVSFQEGEERLQASVVGSSLLLSKETERIRWAIDRIKDAGSGEAAGGLPPEIMASRPDSGLLFISARGGYAGQVVGLVRRGAPEFASVLDPMMEGAGPVTIRAHMATPDVLEGEIRVAAGSPGEEPQAEYAGTVTAVLPSGELTMSLESIPRGPGERHAWRMRVTGLGEVAFRSLEILDADERRPESVPEITVEPEKDPGE